MAALTCHYTSIEWVRSTISNHCLVSSKHCRWLSAATSKFISAFLGMNFGNHGIRSRVIWVRSAKVTSASPNFELKDEGSHLGKYSPLAFVDKLQFINRYQCFPKWLSNVITFYSKGSYLCAMMSLPFALYPRRFILASLSVSINSCRVLMFG